MIKDCWLIQNGQRVARIEGIEYRTDSTELTHGPHSLSHNRRDDGVFKAVIAGPLAWLDPRFQVEEDGVLVGWNLHVERDEYRQLSPGRWEIGGKRSNHRS